MLRAWLRIATAGRKTRPRHPINERSTHERHGRKKFWHWWRDSRVDPPPSGAKMPTFPGLAPPVFIRGGGWFLIPTSRGFFRGLRQAAGCASFIERGGCARGPISARHISQYRRTSFMRWPKVGAKTGKWHGGTGMYFVAVIRAIRAAFTHRRYRPELHYMRGPGPKWFERHGR